MIRVGIDSPWCCFSASCQLGIILIFFSSVDKAIRELKRGHSTTLKPTSGTRDERPIHCSCSWSVVYPDGNQAATTSGGLTMAIHDLGGCKLNHKYVNKSKVG
uniref:Uncharacterized protein n=1 Tax=Kalanchoe fedtschenkoi TaxID=63787 RepID=A0A7N0SZ95_KALFE